ncbi:MAG: hypothetical protein KJ042_09390 [Deltaproteobacteria bacterium]|nr:hypothetical protein [Deltaproteobacteria bacterium]
MNSRTSRRTVTRLAAATMLLIALCGASWEQRANLPASRYGGVLFPAGGALYYMGGSDSTWYDGMPEVWRYDPDADSWDARSPMLVGTFLAAGGVVGNDIYLLGGAFISGVTAYVDFNVRVYDTILDSWTVGSVLGEIHQGSAYTEAGHDILVFGGSDTASAIVNSVFVFDTDSMDISTGPPMGTTRWMGAAWTADGSHYVAGGTGDGVDGVSGASVLAADDVAFSDADMEDLPEKRIGAAYARAWDEVALEWRFYLLGGRDETGVTHDTAWSYAPATDTWSDDTSLPSPRYLASATCWNGSLWLAGGMNGAGGVEDSFYRLGVGSCSTTGADDDGDDDAAGDDDSADDDGDDDQADDADDEDSGGGDDDDDGGCCGC